MSLSKKGAFWNSDGFRDPKKHRFISDLTKEHNLSFIATSETGRRSFTNPFIKNLCSGKNYLWQVKEPKGRSGGGILLGIDLEVFDIGALDEGDYYVKFHMSVAGRCVLINSVLTGLGMFMLSFFNPKRGTLIPIILFLL